MPFQYITYSRQAIKAPVIPLQVGRYRLDYLAFSRPENTHKPPLLVVGGAFQTFNSYKYCVERIYDDFPVVLIDLPSLGNNEQIAPDMGMEELADMLYQMVEMMEYSQVHLMGLSLGSAVAAAFAYKYPQVTGKLITAGVVVSPRKSWRLLIDESVKVLDEGRMDPFSQAVVLYLINYQRLQETGMNPTARKLFYRQMKRLNDNERERYKINGRRLSTTPGLLGFPPCETLVTTGEYDSFTLPWENAAFAKGCPNGRFVLIENADHLPQLEQREVSLELFSSFLNGKPLEQVKGIRLLNKADIGKLEKRRDVRRLMVNPSVRLVTEPDSPNPLNLPATVVDINYYGCLLEINDVSFAMEQHQRDCEIRMELPNVTLGVLIFERASANRYRCLFKHGSVELSETFIEQLKDPDFFLQAINTDVKLASLG